MMDPAKLAEAVVRDLSRHRARNDIILDVCRSSGMDWPQADAFVSQVAQSSRKEIARRQAPLLLILAAIAVVGGFSSIVSMADAALSGRSVYLPYLPIPYSGNIVYFSLGVAGVAGGILGIVILLRQAK